MKIVTVVGARPQFIKAAVFSRAIRTANAAGGASPMQEFLVHTGQHFDENMSGLFFSELDIPAPSHHLGIAGGPHGQMTGRMLEAIESVLQDLSPDLLLVYGDTNSTLAGALAAAKMHIPVAHVEAGLRSFNRAMPEEVNRVLTDHVSDLLFAPTSTAVANLHAEGIDHGRIQLVGDVMYDAMRFYRTLAESRSDIIDALDLGDAPYILATVHRAENTDDPDRMDAILRGLRGLAAETTVVLPLHPRTRRTLAERTDLDLAELPLRLIEPVGYLDMVMLEARAGLIATDSGGVQKEAYFHGVPCITMRDETEWVELVSCGANELVGADADRIIAAGRAALGRRFEPGDLYGTGDAAERILATLSGRAHAHASAAAPSAFGYARPDGTCSAAGSHSRIPPPAPRDT